GFDWPSLNALFIVQDKNIRCDTFITYCFAINGFSWCGLKTKDGFTGGTGRNGCRDFSGWFYPNSRKAGFSLKTGTNQAHFCRNYLCTSNNFSWHANIES